jgi:RNA polymerase sigma-70 factor (ECF subfamily)
LPEPILERDEGPAALLELARSCELALLYTLERLNEEEQAALLLRQVFDTDYADIARILGRKEDACRQLVRRAGRRVKEEDCACAVTSMRLEEAVLKFVLATSAGDKQTVLSLLAPDVVAVSDGGGVVRAALIPLNGREKVAQVMTHIASKAAREAAAGALLPKLAMVNGRPAIVLLEGTQGDMILTLRLNSTGQISWIYTLRNPNKLALVKRR